MHELSVALSVVDIATEAMERAGPGRVQAVHVKLGPLSGVDTAALLSAFELAREGSALAHAQLVIEEVPIAIYCPACAAERPVQSIQLLLCTVCGTPGERVVRGNELQLTALEMES
jgi:hydrogenase nickel incorporation protein HypA/HybF